MSKNIKSNQAGIAHLGLFLVLLVFVAVGALVYWRFSSTSDKSNGSSVSQTNKSSDEEKLQGELNDSTANIDQDTNTSADVSDSGEGLTNE